MRRDLVLLGSTMLLAVCTNRSTMTTNSNITSIPSPQPALISRLAWLAGCWEQRAVDRLTQEQWMAPAGGTMIGMGRTIVGGSTQAWESLRIVPGDGTLTYIAQPAGQGETSFAATLLNDTLAVFENPAHDFPQRIAYRRVGRDSVIARISAVRDGQTRGMDIPMQRAVCGV